MELSLILADGEEEKLKISRHPLALRRKPPPQVSLGVACSGRPCGRNTRRSFVRRSDEWLLAASAVVAVFVLPVSMQQLCRTKRKTAPRLETAQSLNASWRRSMWLVSPTIRPTRQFPEPQPPKCNTIKIKNSCLVGRM